MFIAYTHIDAELRITLNDIGNSVGEAKGA
jgi:hypothetical protein